MTSAITSRPATLVFVSGTGTDVGKTWWTAAVLRADGTDLVTSPSELASFLTSRMTSWH